AVARQRGADVGGGPVAVVGQALDEDGDAVGSVALVHDGLVVRPAGLLAGTALDRPVDVVVGDRVLLGLLDRVEQGRVAGHVTAIGARRDLDVLDQAGEQLAAPSVNNRLLVLGRRPLGVPGHRLYPSARPTTGRESRTMSTKYRCTRRSPVSSG